MCEAAVQTFQANAMAKGLRIAVTAPVSCIPLVMGDEEKLRRVVMNLVSNAVKFTTRGGVDVGLRSEQILEDVHLSIQVSDSGMGIPADKIGLLFDPFYQVESGMARSHTGTGLGLAISRQLVEAMGGTVRVESDVGSGSTFTIELTLPVVDAPAIKHNNVSPFPSEAAMEHLHGKKVLLVEDNEVNALISQASLESLGLSVIHACDGQSAFELYREHAFDVVMMDCQMPGMDGFTATAHIRRHERATNQPRTPIVALTAYALGGDRELCIANDMDDYLSKPIDLGKLTARLIHWLVRDDPRASSAAALEVPKRAARASSAQLPSASADEPASQLLR
jgi:CheY-like chemotaxis protein/anti-sigma regulatory factor (Ser/Thr protein kinase)